MFNLFQANVQFLEKSSSWFLVAKREKHLWKSDILQVTFRY